MKEEILTSSHWSLGSMGGAACFNILRNELSLRRIYKKHGKPTFKKGRKTSVQ